MKLRSRVTFGLLVLCGFAGSIAETHAQAPVRVFAAASMKDALDEVAQAWREDAGGETLITYAASSTLAKQIEQGAPGDLFVSANTDWMDYLSVRDLTRKSSERALLRNRLVLAAPAASSVTLKIEAGFDLAGALGDGRLAMCNPAVPAGSYGRQALQVLGVWDAVGRRAVLAENVRAALRLVSRGETPLGIVYATDAAADTQVRVVDTFPDDSHDPIVYPAAVIGASRHPQAEALLQYMAGPRAAGIFERWGFAVVDGAHGSGG